MDVSQLADVVTKSMKQAIDETNRRRKIQQAYNVKHNITPKTIRKDITSTFESVYKADVAPAGKVVEALARYESLII